jgi:hypothetical protein
MLKQSITEPQKWTAGQLQRGIEARMNSYVLSLLVGLPVELHNLWSARLCALLFLIALPSTCAIGLACLLWSSMESITKQHGQVTCGTGLAQDTESMEPKPRQWCAAYVLGIFRCLFLFSYPTSFLPRATNFLQQKPISTPDFVTASSS